MFQIIAILFSIILIGCTSAAKPNPIDTQVNSNCIDAKEHLIKLVKSPDHGTYMALRQMIISCENYEPYSFEVKTAFQLAEQNKLDEAKEIVLNGMKNSNLLLSPRAHHFLSFMFFKLNDKSASDSEWVIGDACIKGILATGDGSRQNPFIVLRTSDEHDVIKHFRKELEQQSLISLDGKYMDLIKCQDGSEYWFDITAAYNKLNQKYEK